MNFNYQTTDQAVLDVSSGRINVFITSLAVTRGYAEDSDDIVLVFETEMYPEKGGRFFNSMPAYVGIDRLGIKWAFDQFGRNSRLPCPLIVTAFRDGRIRCHRPHPVDGIGLRGFRF